MAATNNFEMISMLSALTEVLGEVVAELFPFYAGQDLQLARDRGGKKANKKKNKKGKKDGSKDSKDAADGAAVKTRPAEYKSTLALKLNAVLKKEKDFADAGLYKSPRDIANAIVAGVQAHPKGMQMLESVEAAGPGFVMLKMSSSWLAEQVRLVAGARRAGPPAGTEHKRVVVDFSSPNIAKEMHVGHLRSTIIGDSICRVLEFCNFDVLRTNHVGDWGTQFGMLITHLRDEHPNFEQDPPNISDLQGFYRAAKTRFDSDEDFKSRSYSAVVSLQAREESSIRAWEMICDVSRKEFQKIYDRLGVVTHEKGESFYHDKLAGIVEHIQNVVPFKGTFEAVEGESEEELKARKAAFVEEVSQSVSLEASALTEDKGAVLFWITNPREPNAPMKPLIIKKADGGYTYATTDFAALKYRKDELEADWIFYVVDSGQASHLECVFKGGEHAGLYDPATTRIEHVGFGVVVGEDGKKFKTRSGDVVRLVDLLNTAVEGAEKIIREKVDERRSKIEAEQEAGNMTEAEAAAAVAANVMSEEEIAAAASAIGHGCVKYADLRCNRINNYMFSFERMLDMRGNTAVYLLYAYARMASIVRVATERLEGTLDVAQFMDSAAEHTDNLVLDDVAEQSLAYALLRFPEEIQSVLETLMPSKICELLYELSTVFSNFYASCTVVNAEDIETTKSRLLLIRATLGVFETAFDLLGVEYVGRL